MTVVANNAKPLTSVVVVEDDPASADVLQRRLQANNMTVAVGRDGGEGLALVKKIIPDLVLLDVMLPDTDGYDVCLRIKSDGNTAHIPVIFLSARGEVVDKVRGLSCGAADYVTKPWNAAELLARIDAVLAQARSARAPRLEKPTLRPQRPRPLVAIALSDGERRRRAQGLLSKDFDIVEEGGQGADLMLVDAGGAVPQNDIADDETAMLEIVGDGVAPGQDAARLDEELPRIAALIVRENRIQRDLDAAADALITVATALESHDRATMGHSERVASRAVAIAQVLGLDEQATKTIRLGALLRDIGNAKLPPALVHKAGELKSGERELVEQHPIFGEQILKGLAPLRAILPIVRSHHERLDGGGYPDKLRAEQLPLEVRVVTVADRFEALLVDRPDRVGVSEPEAVRIIQGAVAKGEVDPAVVAALAAQVRSAEGSR